MPTQIPPTPEEVVDSAEEMVARSYSQDVAPNPALAVLPPAPIVPWTEWLPISEIRLGFLLNGRADVKQIKFISGSTFVGVDSSGRHTDWWS